MKKADNKSDKVEASAAAQRLVDKDKVHVVLGSWGSSLSMTAGLAAFEVVDPDQSRTVPHNA